MIESGYYPEGTEYNPSSPWNEEPTKEHLSTHKCVVTETISSVRILEYDGERDIVDIDDDELEDLFCEQEYSIIDLLDKLKQYLNIDLKSNKKLTKEQHISIRKMLNTINNYSFDNFNVKL